MQDCAEIVGEVSRCNDNKPLRPQLFVHEVVRIIRLQEDAEIWSDDPIVSCVCHPLKDVLQYIFQSLDSRLCLHDRMHECVTGLGGVSGV